MTSDQAEKAIADAGLKAQYAGNESSSATKDTVSRQDPAAGKEVDEGTTVKYWISTGPESVSVPSVVGKTQSDAKTALENAGLKVDIQPGGYSSQYDEGVVMSQDITGKADKGTTVTILVSKGADPEANKVTVPSVIGMTQSQAINTLLDYGLKYDVQTASSGSGTAGNVVKQSVTAGEKVDSGTTVTIYVAPESSDSKTSDGSSSSGQGTKTN